MIIGPAFYREVTVAPRQPKLFIFRSLYGGVILLLICTAWLVVTGTQLVRDTGDFARFGGLLFQLLAPLQLVILLFSSAILAAGAVAQEKDRKTLVLLLLTRMTNAELVFGKLLASLLSVLILLLTSLPLFMVMTLLGGISYAQVIRVLVVTLWSLFVCGSLGSCMALWRDKTFQALAATILIIVAWLGFWEAVHFGYFGKTWGMLSTNQLAMAMSPWQAIQLAAQPTFTAASGLFWSISGFLTVFTLLGILINGIAILMVRVWNPSRETRLTSMEEDTWRKEEKSSRLPQPVHVISAASGKVRHVWNNPIAWREICTHAYGRKTLVLRFAYILLFFCAAWMIHSTVHSNAEWTLSQFAAPYLPLLILSLILVNAQAVTSLTSERDGGTFVLLLASDISPKEFVYGKLGGTFYNMKEMFVLPLALSFYFWWANVISLTNACFLMSGLLVLYFFVAMTGIYIGMQYENTRSAIATSLGLIFFLFIGIATCMWIMVGFSGSFEVQLQSFLAFMIGGSIGIYIAIGARNPSAAIGLASFILPIATFYSITSMLLGQYHFVFIAAAATYGFTTVAMLIPAVDEFDVATGRTTAD
ncbi:MAG: ABC transporter permease subunit [Planctomycetaceae bacterium]|jgi:ABC-type transport system involved in multi-copper enzyme maturation permease subunit|nr:ABC transporter permease subunit [Planctomycetaceae bacterium]